MRNRKDLRKWLGGLGVGLAVGGAGMAQEIEQVSGGFKRKIPVSSATVPCNNCPPGYATIPGTTVPGTIVPAPMPGAPGSAAPAPAPGTGTPPVALPPVAPGAVAAPAFTQAEARGTAGTASITPNMFGDIFGGRSSRTSFTTSRPGVTNGWTAQVVLSSIVPLGPPGQPNTIDPNSNLTKQTPKLGISQTGLTFVPGLSGLGTFTEDAFPVGTTFTPVNQLFVRSALTFISTPASANIPNPFGPTAEIARGALYNQIAAAEAAAGGRLTSLELGALTASYEGLDPLQVLNYYSTIMSTVGQTVFINVSNPAGGGNVGRTKMAEDNNPLPRDRVIFNYDYFNNVRLTQGGWDVNRINVGLEKTFADGFGSVEIRVPFAATLNSNMSAGAESTSTELGNVRAAFKFLPIRGETTSYGAGFAVNFPTAEDVLVSSGGRQILRINNQATTFEPYIAMLATPNDRMFAQAWGSISFDPFGNPVQSNAALFGTGSLGRIYDATLLALDAQVGYWIYQSNTGLLSGVAPFLELHYNSTIGDGTILRTGNGFAIGDTSGNLDELNLSTGFVTTLSNNTTISVGAAFPLRTGQNRTFDYQIGVRANWFYGDTNRTGSLANVSTFGQ